jgi:hypothetical protein
MQKLKIRSGETQAMNRHMKCIVISTSISFGINIVLFIKSATPVSGVVSEIDRILMWVTAPVEVVTDWIIPGHVNLKQLIVFFSFSLIFYAFVVWIFLELWTWGCRHWHKRVKRNRVPTY